MKQLVKPILAAIVVGCLSLPVLALISGCGSFSMGTPQSQMALYYAGSKAATKAIQSNPGNIDKVQLVVDALDALQEKGEGIVIETVEQWYKEFRKEIKIDPLDLQMLETIVIFPLWQELKNRYGEVSIGISDPKVVSDLNAFKSGLLRAIQYYREVDPMEVSSVPTPMDFDVSASQVQ